jgi:hypothetical protein
MEQNPKLPIHEASGKRPLDGSYKVSFNIEMSSEDNFTISDLTQALSEGFEPWIERVANVSVEKLTKEGKPEEPRILKVGDRVRFSKAVTVKATILEDDGYYSVGMPTESSAEVGEHDITITEGSHAIVNQIKDGKAELIEIDTEAMVSFKNNETDEVWENPVSVDKVLVDVNVVEGVL